MIALHWHQQLHEAVKPLRVVVERLGSLPIQPLLLAIALFMLNNLAILNGWLNPPPGYVPAYAVRAQDIAQYLTWLNAFQLHWPIQNYHAPWLTEPALFNPLIWLLAKVCFHLGIRGEIGIISAHFLFHVIAAYALYSLLRTFTATPRQLYITLLVIICSVPLRSLAIVPRLVIGHGIEVPPGLGDFVWWSSDGFFHGISGSFMVTFGTATMLSAFWLLGKYLQSGQKKYLVFASLVSFLSAFIHPFEVFVIASAGSLAFIWRRGRQWRAAVPEVLTLGIASALGLAPYIIQALRHQWLMDVAELNRWNPGSPLGILVMLGLPTILVLVLLALRTRITADTDRLLVCWFGCTLVGIYVPWIPWSQHLLDGFHYASGTLLVRLAWQNKLVNRTFGAFPRAARTVFATWCLLSLFAYSTFYYWSYKDGNDAKPANLFSTVAQQDEAAVISWLKDNADPDQLVLAPKEHASWLATVPMHSFASHSLFSLTYWEQERYRRNFYLGEMHVLDARRMLSEHGIHYVVIPKLSPAIGYLNDSEKRAEIGVLLIYQLDNNSMKPYPGLHDVTSTVK